MPTTTEQVGNTIVLQFVQRCVIILLLKENVQVLI